MPIYQYPCFFKAENLSDEEMKKIRKYFQIRRQSGGGECGEVEDVGDNTYKISFLEHAARERVFSKTDHTVNLPGRGNLHIVPSLHDTREEEKEPLAHSLPDQQVSFGSKTIEKVLEMDQYLLRYLKENQTAGFDLVKRLSLLSDTFVLDPDTEKVVVMKDVDKTSHDDIDQRKWEAKVEKVFLELKHQYLVHFVTEAESLKILKENDNLSLSEEDLSIYEETDFAVIVGDTKQVKTFLEVLNVLQLPEEVSKEYLMSKTKYTLIKEQLEQNSNFSGVKFTLKIPDTLVLRGPEGQVQAASTKLHELENQIQKKRVQLHPAVAKFLESNGAAQDFQTRFHQSLRSLVMVEITGSDLVLLSLSIGALDEAAVAVQRDLCVETLTLIQTESQSPGVDQLKEALSQALQHGSHGSPEVDVNFESESSLDLGIKVQLVGYRTEVCRLKNIIQNYKQNHADFTDTMNLPIPVIVDIFADVLKLLGLKSNKVNLVPTLSPFPMIHLSGPRYQVENLKTELSSAFNSLIINETAVDGPGVLQFFQKEFVNIKELLQKSCEVLILPRTKTHSSAVATRCTAWTPQNPPTTVSSTQGTHPGHSVNIEILFGSLEDQKVDVLVAPMVNTNLTSTKVGKCLLQKGKQQFKSDFDAAKGKCKLSAGDVLEVDGTALGCKKVFFIECMASNKGMDCREKAIHCGLQRILALCEQQSWHSVALPVIGPGSVLSIPVCVALDILTEVIGMFGLSGPTGLLNSICIVIMPGLPDTEQNFQGLCSRLGTKMVDLSGQAVFSSLRSEIDDIIINLGMCQLHLVFGDISNETTDAIVNTTDFINFQTGVCNNILTIAGPQVQSDLKGARVITGQIFITPPGAFPCKVIMHVSGEKDPAIIKKLARDIVKKCEHDGYRSVAIPAICAGIGGLDAGQVAQSIFQGVGEAIMSPTFRHLKTIRIILWTIPIFMQFKEVAQQFFGTQMAAPVPLTSYTAATGGHQPPSSTLDLQSLVQSLPVQQNKAEFVVVGLTAEKVLKACHQLHQAYMNQCCSQPFSEEGLRHLSRAEVEYIINNTSLGIDIKQFDQGGFIISGLTSGVNMVTQMVQETLLRQVKVKEQDGVFARVSWCLLGRWGVWERLPKKAHYQLEKNSVTEGIMDAHGRWWTVQLTNMEVTEVTTGWMTKLKRLENPSDFYFPLYWDNMGPGEILTVITLRPGSAEYTRVKNDFKKTVQKTVLKIERIQNVHLRQAYEVRKKEMQEKNKPPVGAGERILYHGTSQTACSAIMNTRFDRGFAGHNATRYGNGSYFAVNACYSAYPTYSVPASDGTQLMFVARVLTGNYTQGNNKLKCPPLIPSQDLHSRYDSVVDNMQNPNMFVVFHDCQAYPDYLITFK